MSKIGDPIKIGPVNGLVLNVHDDKTLDVAYVVVRKAPDGSNARSVTKVCRNMPETGGQIEEDVVDGVAVLIEGSPSEKRRWSIDVEEVAEKPTVEEEAEEEAAEDEPTVEEEAEEEAAEDESPVADLPTSKGVGANDAKDAIAAMESADEVRAYVANEKRVSITGAAEERIAALEG